MLSRTYTDQEIDKLRHNDGNPFKLIERLRTDTDAQFKALNALIAKLQDNAACHETAVETKLQDSEARLLAMLEELK